MMMTMEKLSFFFFNFHAVNGDVAATDVGCCIAMLNLSNILNKQQQLLENSPVISYATVAAKSHATDIVATTATTTA